MFVIKVVFSWLSKNLRSASSTLNCVMNSRSDLTEQHYALWEISYKYKNNSIVSIWFLRKITFQSQQMNVESRHINMVRIREQFSCEALLYIILSLFLQWCVPITRMGHGWCSKHDFLEQCPSSHLTHVKYCSWLGKDCFWRQMCIMLNKILFLNASSILKQQAPFMTKYLHLFLQHIIMFVIANKSINLHVM